MRLLQMQFGKAVGFSSPQHEAAGSAKATNDSVVRPEFTWHVRKQHSRLLQGFSVVPCFQLRG
jgi:hypothetical protein